MLPGKRDFYRCCLARRSASHVNKEFRQQFQNYAPPSLRVIGERAKRARHSQVCSIENRGYIYYHIMYTRKMVPIKKRAGVIPYIFSSSLALLSSLLSCSFYLLDQRTISGVEIPKMTGKTAQSYNVLTTATFQAYRRLTVKSVRSRNIPI